MRDTQKRLDPGWHVVQVQCEEKQTILSSRWEEEKSQDGVKWKQLEHKGPYFAPSYEPLPDGVHFYYDGEDPPQ